MMKLPEGFVPQVDNHREVGSTSYEFNRVYRPDGKLDPGMSFWVVTPLDQGDRPVAREITYAQYQSAYGRSARSLMEFGSHDLPVEQLEEWLLRKPAG
jgi:hypothetical protein